MYNYTSVAFTQSLALMGRFEFDELQSIRAPAEGVEKNPKPMSNTFWSHDCRGTSPSKPCGGGSCSHGAA